MKLFSSIAYEEDKIFFISLTIFLLIVFIEIIIILILNSGLIFFPDNSSNQKINKTVLLFIILLIIATNLIGLIFLGYVSYRNDNYVMDLFGLASLEALNHWRANDKSDWIDAISKKHNVKFAMVYDSWFHHVPANWYKVAELYLGKIKISPSDSVVSFYILNDNIKDKMIPLLKRYKRTLPQDVRLKIHINDKNN